MKHSETGVDVDDVTVTTVQANNPDTFVNESGNLATRLWYDSSDTHIYVSQYKSVIEIWDL